MKRRAFLRYGLEATLVAGAVYAFGATSSKAAYVRPPGALSEEELRQKCIRCGACVVECPSHALMLQDLSLDFTAIGTPVIHTKRDGCLAWKERCTRCTDICPTGALVPFDLKKARLARVHMESPKELCENCMVCFQRCPVEGAVLFPNPNGEPFTREQDIPTELKLRNAPTKPYFNPERCVGCGLCAAHCPPKILSLQPLS